MSARVTVAGAKLARHPIGEGPLTWFWVSGVLVAIIGVTVWNFYFRTPRRASLSRKRIWRSPCPTNPAFHCALPFANMSGDPEQEYFNDGLTEEIITALSKTPANCSLSSQFNIHL